MSHYGRITTLSFLLLLGFLDVRLVSGPRTVHEAKVLVGTPGRVLGPGTRRDCVRVLWVGALDTATGQAVRVEDVCVGWRAIEYLDAEVVDEPRRPLTP